MRKFVAGFLALASLFAWTGVARPGDDDDARAVINKAIKAGGGEANLAKFESAIMKEKGMYYGKGDGLPYTSIVYVKRPDRFKMEIAGVFTICLDGDKGWMKSEMGLTDMSKEEIEVQQINQKAGWIMSLLSLKDKAYAVASDGTADVEGMKTTVVKVSRMGYPTVKLYFDKKSGHLVKSQFKAISSEQKKEVTAESYFSDFKMADDVTLPHHLVLKHDGKLYVEADVTEMKAAKLDAKSFAKPAS
jgi:hypothetical protein